MPGITLNGQRLEGKAGQTVLDVARENGVYIPTLCYHPGLGPYGACRLCLVEIKGGFRLGLASSCSLPVMDRLTIETESPLVKEGRKLVAGLLLARAPQSPKIRTLAESLGVTSTDFAEKDELCVLCGRCVRACAALGINAISFAQRGADRRVAVPFDRPSKQCIGCQACVAVCPTGAINAKISHKEVLMEEWRTLLSLQLCTCCGKGFVSERQQAHVDEILNEGSLSGGTLCPQCRRLKTAKNMASLPSIHYQSKIR